MTCNVIGWCRYEQLTHEQKLKRDAKDDRKKAKGAISRFRVSPARYTHFKTREKVIRTSSLYLYYFLWWWLFRAGEARQIVRGFFSSEGEKEEWGEKGG